MTKGRAALLLFVFSALLLLPGTAQAHSELESSKPAEGATAKNPPDHIVLHFSEEPSEQSVVTVSDGCTKNLVDDSFVAGNAFHIQLVGGTGGEYEVAYSLVSTEDGHATEGSYSFNVQGAVDCSAGDDKGDKGKDKAGDDGGDQAAPGTEPTGDEEDSSSPMVWILIGGLAAIVIAVIARLATRR